MSTNLPAVTKPRPSLRRGVGGLTDQQRRFVHHYTSTPGAIGNAAEAARQAGYSERSAKELGRQLLDLAHVRDAIGAAHREAISGRLMTKATHRIEQILDDDTAPKKLWIEAYKTLADRAGIMPPTVAERERDDDGNKPLAEMTADELQRFIDREEAALAALRDSAPAGSTH